MLTEGYDYPPADRYRECERCNGTGRVYTIGRLASEDGELTDVHEVDEYTYEHCPDIDEANIGEWCRDDDRECRDCDGTGWIDKDEEEEWARCERYDAEREERLLRAAGY